MLSDDPEWIIERRRDLGERIADLRIAAHYTQERFAEATGLSRSHIQRIEAGQSDPRYGELMRIAAVLDTRVSLIVD